MTFWVAGAVVGSSLLGASASKSAASTQAASTDRAADLQYQQWRESVGLQEPWRQAGMTALNKLVPLATEYTPFGMDQFQADPGYGFRMSEGMKALERSAAAKGGLLSGATLKGIQRYGQDLGSQEYQNAFNRYQTERASRLQPLQSLAGVGQTAANTLGQAGQTMAGNVGNLMTSGAAASAAGQVGAANALTGGLSTYLNYTNQNNLLNALQNRQPINYGYSSQYAGPPTAALPFNP
jgi:hypothetical protein